jgi:hypothetical protein
MEDDMAKHSAVENRKSGLWRIARYVTHPVTQVGTIVFFHVVAVLILKAAPLASLTH